MFSLSSLPSVIQCVAKRQTDGGLVISLSVEFFQNPSKGPTFDFSPHGGFSVCSGNGASVGSRRSMISYCKENIIRLNFPRAVSSYRTENISFSRYPSSTATLIFHDQWIRTAQETHSPWGFTARHVF